MMRSDLLPFPAPVMLLPKLLVCCILAGCAPEERQGGGFPEAEIQTGSEELDGQSESPAGGWRPVYFSNERLRDHGVFTGDGTQYVRAVAIAPSDGDFFLWGTDVGGIFRSLDAGSSWEPCNVGFHPRGVSALAVDPHNADRVLAVGANSVATPYNGIYLSEDKAASWTQTLPVNMAASRDMRRQLVFDPTSYDAAADLTRKVYWSRLSAESPPGERFLRSADGGVSWTPVPGADRVADAELAVDPGSGAVVAANPGGLHRSEDGGDTWTTVLPGPMTSVAVSAAAPGSVWATGPMSLYHSTDGGRTFTTLEGIWRPASAAGELRGLRVSPADPEHLVLWRKAGDWDFPRYASHDGGRTWTRAEVQTEGLLLPVNSREGWMVFHPEDPDLLLAPGGDMPMVSRDGGLRYEWSGNGVNNLYVGSGFNFSVINPDICLMASQDYATLFTVNGGRDWEYLSPGGKEWGGFNYAGYASDPENLLVGESESWGGPRRRAVSHDGGATWLLDAETIDPAFTYGAPGHPEVLFAGDRRSDDAGRTWHPLDGLDSVRTHDSKTGDLYGVSRAEEGRFAILRSSDAGMTWQAVVTGRGGSVRDLAVDGDRGRIYLVVDDRLKVWDPGVGRILPIDSLVPDQEGAPRVRSVAVDPVDPGVVYIAANRDVFASNASAQRSLDAGKTWENLIRNQPLGGDERDGGREAQWVRVHAGTREAWFATGCYGIWRHSPPRNVQPETRP